ncbi:MAG TPA: curli assembly protein CsgF [Acetobacteraceae bacterium]|nr:curli assembly protein CsgF [Acetobacteraceae bacterium]
MLASAVLAVGVIAVGQAYGGDLIYTPINPSFGGNPNNESALMDAANAQKTATAPVAPSTTTGPGTTQSQSNAQLFVSELEGQLFSELANQVTQAIFGTNPQNNGTITFGDTTVVFDRTATAINLTITDFTTGQVTQISVPQLVTSN